MILILKVFSVEALEAFSFGSEVPMGHEEKKCLSFYRVITMAQFKEESRISLI